MNDKGWGDFTQPVYVIPGEAAGRTFSVTVDHVDRISFRTIARSMIKGPKVIRHILNLFQICLI